MPTKITYNGKTTELADGYIATLPCKDLKMETDVVVEAPEGEGGSSSGGAELNIAYGDTAPEDTSKLWVKTSKPSAVKVSSELEEILTGKGAFVDTGLGMSVNVTYCQGAYVNEHLYAFGGYHTNKYQNTIKRINVRTGEEITFAATLPIPLADASTCVYDGAVYVFGGRSGSNNSIQQTIYKFDVTTETLTTLSATIPQGRYNAAVCVNGTKAYIFGGYYGTYDAYSLSADILCLDFETETLETLSTLPSVVGNMGVCSYGQYIYLFGGYYGGSTYDNRTDCIFRFDCVNLSFRTLSAKIPAKTTNRIPLCEFKDSIYGFYSKNAFCFDPTTETVSVISTDASVASSYCFVLDDKIWYGQTSAIKNFIPEMSIVLPMDILQIQYFFGANVCKLINTDMVQLEAGIKGVYKGNADGIGEQVEASLHNGTSWVTI